jgi:hypothetical protein
MEIDLVVLMVVANLIENLINNHKHENNNYNKNDYCDYYCYRDKFYMNEIKEREVGGRNELTGRMFQKLKKWQ